MGENNEGRSENVTNPNRKTETHPRRPADTDASRVRWGQSRKLLWGRSSLIFSVIIKLFNKLGHASLVRASFVHDFISSYPHNSPMCDTLILHQKESPREAKHHGPGHTAHTAQTWALNPGLPSTRSLCNSMLHCVALELRRGHCAFLSQRAQGVVLEIVNLFILEVTIHMLSALVVEAVLDSRFSSLSGNLSNYSKQHRGIEESGDSL